MTRLAKSLIAGTVLATLTLTQAFAGGSSDQQSGSEILNGQVNLHTVDSSVRASVDSVGQDVAIQSSATGNSLDVTTMNDTTVTNNQYVSSVDISSDLGASVTNVGGNVSIQGQAVCNAASVSTDPALTQVTSTQECDAVDPSSGVYAYAANIGGDLSVSNLAAGNTFEADTNATNMPVSTNQINRSSINAMTTATVSDVAGSVSVNSQAVGNSAQIIHYSTN